MRRIALAVLFACAWISASDAKPAPKPAPTVAAPDARCQGYTATILSRLRDMVAADPTFELAIFSDDRAKKILDAFNAQEPKTDIHADRIMVLTDQDEEGRALVMFISNGCIVGRPLPAPRKMWRDLVSKAIGSDS